MLVWEHGNASLECLTGCCTKPVAVTGPSIWTLIQDSKLLGGTVNIKYFTSVSALFHVIIFHVFYAFTSSNFLSAFIYIDT